MSALLLALILLQVRTGDAATRPVRDSGAEVNDRDPNRPATVARPTTAGTYGVRIVTTTVTDPEATDRWSAGKTTTRNVDVTVDPSRHCRIYLVDGQWVRGEEQDYVIVQATKR